MANAPRGVDAERPLRMLVGTRIACHRSRMRYDPNIMDNRIEEARDTLPSRRSPATDVQTAPPALIVIFGGSGDLTRRKLAPALHTLACAGRLDPATRIVGVGRRPMDDDAYRERLFEGIQEYARLRSDPDACPLWPDLRSRFAYRALVSSRPEDVAHLVQDLAGPSAGNVLFYLATPPEAVPDIVRGLGHAAAASEVSGWRRLVVEKPFGRDLADARELNRVICKAFSEEQVLRIDHYLGKETVQNLLAFRFANTIFEPLWNRDHVDHVQITVAEAIGVGERAGTYDRSGVLRDIVQNHLLQLLALTVMEPPETLDPETLRDRKIEALRAVRPIGPEDFVLGQYAGYREEDNVSEASSTPTYAALRLFLDNERWHDVPFYVRTGKRLATKTTELTLQFRTGSHAFLRGEAPNRLSLLIQPDEGIQLQFDAKIPGAGMRTRPEDMVFRFKDRYGESALPDAYERLLLDALHGDPSLFIRRDEVERAWELIDPLLDDERAPEAYEQGSWGPQSAEALLADGTRWLAQCHPSDDEET